MEESGGALHDQPGTTKLPKVPTENGGESKPDDLHTSNCAQPEAHSSKKNAKINEDNVSHRKLCKIGWKESGGVRITPPQSIDK